MNRDAIRFLQEQHHLMRILLCDLEAQPTRAVEARRQLLEKVSNEVGLHSVIEEAVVFPALKELLHVAGQPRLFLELLEHHHLVDFDFVVTEMHLLHPAAKEFGERARLLGESVEDHTREEDALLSRARLVCPDERLHALGLIVEGLRSSIAHPTESARAYDGMWHKDLVELDSRFGV